MHNRVRLQCQGGRRHRQQGWSRDEGTAGDQLPPAEIAIIVALERENWFGTVDEAGPGGDVAGMDAMMLPRMEVPGRQHELNQQYQHCEGREGGLLPALLHSIGLQNLTHFSGNLRHD